MAKLVKEIEFTTPDQIGVLNSVAQTLKNAGVNIEQAAAWSEGDKGVFRLVTSNNGRAIKALKTIGFEAKEKEALQLVLKNKKGELAKIADKLAMARINLHCLTATSAGGKVSVVLHTEDNRKAKKIV